MKKTLVSFILLFSFVSNSQTIFRDDFSTYTSGQQLSGQGSWTNNSASAGGLGTCSSGVGCLNAKVLATPIAYNGYGSSANSVELKPDTDGCGTPFTAITSTNMYVSFIFNISNASVTPTDFFRVMAGNNANVPFRVTARLLQPGFFNIGVSKGSGGVLYFSGALAFNTTHLIVMRYTTNTGTADDAIRMYVNPSLSLGEPATADTGTTIGTDVIGNIDRLAFRQNAFAIPTGRAGLVSVAGSWSSLRFQNLDSKSFFNNSLKINSTNIKNGFIEINSNETMNNVKLKIFDIQGKILDNKIILITANENKITVNPINVSGIYILEITNEEGFKQTRKLFVN